MGRLLTALVAVTVLMMFYSFPLFGGEISEVPEPLINPLSDLSAYENVQYSQDGSLDLEIQEGDAVRTEFVQGEIWYLRTKPETDQDTCREKLKAYVRSTGGTLLDFRPDRAVFSVKDGDDTWWCSASMEWCMDLTVIRELRIVPGKPLTFKMGEGGKTDVRFSAHHSGDKFRSLIITVPNGEPTLSAEMHLISGTYKRQLSNKWELPSIKANRFVIDDIPQEAGKCRFSLDMAGDAPLTDITVELVEYPYPVPKVGMGDRLGAIRIKNVPYGLARLVKATPFGTIYTYHPECPDGTYENGDVTPEGDSFFMLPAGLWQVEVGPQDKAATSSIRALHIPVHAGRETVLDWPVAMTSVFAGGGDGGVKINRVQQKNDSVDVTFTLLGKDAASVTPSVDNLEIKASGVRTKVLSVKRSQVPLEVVLLLDSSGSMKGQMKNALDASRRFVESLPADASVQVVDFDTKPKPIKGKTKAEVLKGLAGVGANGATCLNDAILLGLKMLEGGHRPALLVFTDGFDANYDDSGPGSKATKQEVLDAAAAAEIPIFTIGFGERHDRNTLDRVASLAGGRYYPAADPDALRSVFEIINATLSNTYVAAYRPPTKGRSSDVPVITWMIDISGSMDITPDMSGCDYRIDKMKALLHDFITTLPDNTLGQVMSFEDDVFINQVPTGNRGEILSAVSKLYAGGGTNILEAVRSALLTQAAIPSSKRYMVFVTDAALDVDDEAREEFDTLLGKLKDENIYCLWVGIGSPEAEDAFKHAADLSAGKYVLAKTPEGLKEAFAALAEEIRTVPENKGEVPTLIQLTLKHREESGRNISFAASAQENLPTPVYDSTVAVPASISYTTKELEMRYDAQVADLVTGDSVPIRDTKINKRIPVQVTGKNRAASFLIKEALFMNRLRGVNPPTGQRFLALVMEMRNILPEQEVTVYPDGSNHPATWVGNDTATRGKIVKMVPTYVIPDLKRHLFLRWNKEQMMPVSPASWIAEAPFIMPGENAVAVQPGPPIAGTIIFMVPETQMEQMSLHFYDMNYGHTHIPLVGTIPGDMDRLSGLSAKPPAKLSDAFSLSLREVRDVKKVAGHEAGSNEVFRIVEADFISHVQALLDINPVERFSLRLKTREGALCVRLHNVTSLMPLGFFAPTMLSPGSGNRIRLAFRLPADVAKEAGMGELVVDVRGGGVVIPLDNQAKNAPCITVPKNRIKGDGIDLVINGTGRYGASTDEWVVDLTLFDYKDGQATTLANAFLLTRTDVIGKKPEEIQTVMDYNRSKGLASFGRANAIMPDGLVYPSSITDELIFGFTDSTVIPDGRNLRGLIVFKLPEEAENPGEWKLTSTLFPDLKADLDDVEYRHKRLLTRRYDVELVTSSGFMDQLIEVAARIKRERDAKNFSRPGRYDPSRMDMDNEASPSRDVPVPEYTLAGAGEFDTIKTFEQLKARLARTDYLPSGGRGWQHGLSPEAVLMQNVGTEGDFGRMAEIVLARQGVATIRTMVTLTDKGRAALAARAGLTNVRLEKLPALTYHDNKGRKYVIVSPFMETAPKLSGLVKPEKPYDIPSTPMQATITVSLLAKAIGDKAKATLDATDALGGETDADEVLAFPLLTACPAMPSLSRGAVDIGYTVVGYKTGPVVRAVFDGNDKRVMGHETLDTGEFKIVGEKVDISLGDHNRTFTMDVREEESILDRFHTLGLNLPDMDPKAAKVLETAMQKVHGSSDAPTNLSALKWQGRKLIYRFIAAQTAYEQDLVKNLDLVVGRVEKPRCIVATLLRTTGDDALTMALDLRQVAGQVYDGTHTAMVKRRRPQSPSPPEAKHAYGIMSGLFASRLEEKALPSGGMGFFGMLPYYPEGTEFLWISSTDRYLLYDAMREQEYPEQILRLLEESGNTVLFPSQPALIRGKARWAWLEVNPDTYETIAVLDTGERGAMVEQAFSSLWKDGLDFIVGGLVGISSSIWSVSGFSLIMDDYTEIVAAAKKFALGLADNFSASVKVGDFEFKGKPGDSKPEAAYSGTGSGAIGAYKKYKSLYDMAKSPKIDLGGFEGGFKAGVQFYFSQAGG